MFDVNWLAGPVGRAVHAEERRRQDGRRRARQGARRTPDKSPLAGILRIIPIERMNALLVITPQPAYLDEAKKWIERLDKAGGEGAGIQFYVYAVQNGRAEHIAPLLQQAFTGRVSQQQQAPERPAARAGHPRGHDRLAARVSAAADRCGAECAGDRGVNPAIAQAPAAPRRAGDDPARARAGRGHRRRAQRPGRRRQGQQHGAGRRHARRVLGDRGGAEEARRAAAPGGHRGDHRAKSR